MFLDLLHLHLCMGVPLFICSGCLHILHVVALCPAFSFILAAVHTNSVSDDCLSTVVPSPYTSLSSPLFPPRAHPPLHILCLGHCQPRHVYLLLLPPIHLFVTLISFISSPPLLYTVILLHLVHPQFFLHQTQSSASTRSPSPQRLIRKTLDLFPLLLLLLTPLLLFLPLLLDSNSSS